MLIFQKYVFKAYLKTIFAALGLFLAMFVLMKLIEQLPDFLANENKMTVKQMVMYFVYEMPNSLTYLLPIATLFSIVYTLAHLNSNNELIAYYNSGGGVLLATIPVIAFTAIICLSIFIFEKPFIYDNHQKHRDLDRLLQGHRVVPLADRYDLTVFGSKNKIYFIKEYSPTLTRMKNAQILYSASGGKGIEKIVSAREIVYQVDKHKWLAKDIIVRHYSSNELVSQEMPELELALGERPYHFEKEQKSTLHASSQEIKEMAEKYRIIGGDYRYYYNEYYFKTSVPFTALVIIFFGIPLSTFSRKASVVFSIFLVLLVTIFFFIMSYIGSSLGKVGVFPAPFAGWFGNISFLALALLLWKKIRL